MAVEPEALRPIPETILDMVMEDYVSELEERLREKYQEGLNPSVADARADLVLYLATRFSHPLRRHSQTPEKLDSDLMEKLVEPLQTAAQTSWENLGNELVGRGLQILQFIADDVEHDMDGGIDPVLGEQNARFLINLGRSVKGGQQV